MDFTSCFVVGWVFGFFFFSPASSLCYFFFFLYGLCVVFSVQHVWCFFGTHLPCALFFGKVSDVDLGWFYMWFWFLGHGCDVVSVQDLFGGLFFLHAYTALFSVGF